MFHIYRPLTEPQEWLYRHIEQMFGTGIAFHTVFLVFGARAWLARYLEGPMQFLPWIVPIFVGTVATKWYIARLRSRTIPNPTNGTKAELQAVPLQ
jgi:hypothetical protein